MLGDGGELNPAALRSFASAKNTTVALLGTGIAGDRSFVTDATATTFNSIVAGTGSNKVPVFSDGTNWRIG
jgi:hypothetical protein